MNILLAVKTLFNPSLRMKVLVQQEDKFVMLIQLTIFKIMVLWKTKHKCHLENGIRAKNGVISRGSTTCHQSFRAFYFAV